MHPIWTGLYVVSAAAVAALFQFNLIPGGDAFFIAAALAAVFTGHLVVVGTEDRDVAARPRFSAASSLAYGLCLTITGLITVQTVLTI